MTKVYLVLEAMVDSSENNPLASVTYTPVGYMTSISFDRLRDIETGKIKIPMYGGGSLSDYDRENIAYLKYLEIIKGDGYPIPKGTKINRYTFQELPPLLDKAIDAHESWVERVCQD